MSSDKLWMEIKLTVIEDLGIKLYGKLPPVISEIIANSWDADATRVGITIKDGGDVKDSSITIEDDGYGMSRKELVSKYLKIGRKRREEGEGTTPKGRNVMGRKGIGKLSVFGVANDVEVSTVKNGKKNVFKMNVDDMLACAKKSDTYEPESTTIEMSTGENDGTVIKLTSLKRKTKIDCDSVRRDIAKHFSVFDTGFTVSVNGKEITPADKFQVADMENRWMIENEQVGRPEWTVSGWIGAHHKTLDEEDIGLTIMARRKLIQKPTMFGIKSGGRYSYSYITGEIHAEFMDAERDLVSTNRQSVIWDEPQGEALKEWCAKKLTKVERELSELRRSKRERVIREDPLIKTWISGLEKHELKTANKIIEIITSSEQLDDGRRKEIAEYVVVSFDQKAFKDMVLNIGDHPEPAMLLDVFREWDVIEAREITSIVKGRMSAIEQLGKLIDEGASEVPTLHEFFVDWPWILDPTWTRWQDEVRYSELLREHFPDGRLDEPDRRIDFVAIGTGDTINIIELKRPGHRVKSEDVEQLMRYVSFTRKHLGNSPKSPYSDVAGYLVSGDVADDTLTRDKINEAKEHRRYVVKYEELISNARTVHAEFDKKLKEFEISRRNRQ